MGLAGGTIRRFWAFWWGWQSRCATRGSKPRPMPSPLRLVLTRAQAPHGRLFPFSMLGNPNICSEQVKDGLGPITCSVGSTRGFNELIYRMIYMRVVRNVWRVSILVLSLPRALMISPKPWCAVVSQPCAVESPALHHIWRGVIHFVERGAAARVAYRVSRRRRCRRQRRR